MMAFLAALGARTLKWLTSLGHAAYFFADLLRFMPLALRRFDLVVAQVHAIGNRSLVIIVASGLAVGFVLALQMYYALIVYGAAESVGLVVNLSLVRELGPVVTALLFAGRAGTSLTAEIGLMKAGEQLSAMELMAIDPRARVLAPRFVGGIVAMPILALLFSAIGILGAWVVAVLLIGIDAGNFWSLQQSRVDIWRDVGNGIVKSAVFGVICTFVALYQGYETQATPEGVAYATTRTVVVSSLAVLAWTSFSRR
jgi:phospholipid/cholesterol/gamma-HCH transport system permease protein